MEGYGKCWKNHAAARGGFNYDGCQEFMPSDRDREKCVACGCHRCFHCEKHSTTILVNGVISLPLGNVAGRSRGQTQQPPLSTMALAPMPIAAVLPASPFSRKETPMQRLGGQERRVKQSKLNEGQKAEMRSFAERLGWRVRGEDEGELKMFCAAMGLRTNWFKLWMHKSKPASVVPSSNVEPHSNPPNHA